MLPKQNRPNPGYKRLISGPYNSLISGLYCNLTNIRKIIKTCRGRDLGSSNGAHTKTIQVRRTRHAGHCWRSRDELISDLLLWTPTYGLTKAGRPARTYIQQLCEDTGCSPEDLSEAMNDREKSRERVRDIRGTSTTWWWWWWFITKLPRVVIL